MNFKKEKALLLTHVLRDKKDYKVYSDVKTFEYKGHKFNLQGTYNTEYRISDNLTGVLLTTLPIKRLKDIENENIREAYIEAYVSNTEKVWDLKQDYKNENQHKMLPDLYLAFARATNNKELEKEILETNFEKKEELLKEIEELEEYMKTEEYENNMRGKLEEL